MLRARHSPVLDSLTLLRQERRLSLERAGAHAPRSWFLGPKAENEELLQRLVARAISHAAETRRAYQPDDPRAFAPDAATAEGPQAIETALGEMLHWLKGSIPLSSHRNVSHMYWDQALPAVVGYIAALLYNQNNVAAEASPATTLFEMEVGDDLCRMLGYPVPDPAATGDRPWGHITCDGSVANIESVWAARNARYAGAATAAALRQEPRLAAASGLEVRGLDGRLAPLVDLTPWRLMNLPLGEVLTLATRITEATGIAPDDLDKVLSRHSVQWHGIAQFHRLLLGDTPTPVLLAPKTAHYSWPKAMALTGLGEGALIKVAVGPAGRMEIAALRRELERCLDRGQPVIQVTAVMGSTEESAVDPLEEIVAMREEFRREGMEFSIHADAAWGGYFASLLHPPATAAETLTPVRGGLVLSDGAAAPGILASPHVERQLRALSQADTITVDPHKAGFAPYPAGALCYRNRMMRELISFKAPVVYHGGVDPTVGLYGVEGSKPGAAAAAVYLAHRVIRPDQSGYGDLLSRCIFNSKRFHIALNALEGGDFAVTTFQRLPGGERRAALLRTTGLDDAAMVQALTADPELLAHFRDSGPDLTISSYAFNFKTAAGLNRDPKLMNELNDAIYRALSLQSFDGGKIPDQPMFVTSSSFDPEDYGQDFVTAFAERAGVAVQDGLAMGFLISTVQNPWLSEAGSTGVIATLTEALADTASREARALMARHGIAPPAAAPPAPAKARLHGAAPAGGDSCNCGHCGHGGHEAHMDMDHTTMLAPRVENMPHQHAMTIVGERTLFAVHMTQFYMEEHKYQLIFEIGLDDRVAEALRAARRRAPSDWFVLSNDAHDPFTIPELASGRKASYRGQIFQGLPPFTPEQEESPHFYPWSPDRTLPLITDFEARVKRIVMFRPFAHHLTLPDCATYLVFGKGDEVHMTNLQTARQASGPFEALAFGPDYDHVMSLASRPAGFDDAQIEAGFVATLPAVPLRAPGGGLSVPGHWPCKPGDQMVMRYRGILPEFSAIAGRSYLFGTAVVSSGATLTADNTSLDVSATPEYLLKTT